MAKKTAEPRYKVVASPDTRSSLRTFTIEGSLRQSRKQRDYATRHLQDSPIHRATLSHCQSQRKDLQEVQLSGFRIDLLSSEKQLLHQLDPLGIFLFRFFEPYFSSM